MQSLCVGGITPDGRDAVNELSYLFLSAEGDVGLGAEDMMVRINRLNPTYVKHALETAKKLGESRNVADDTSIQSMLYPSTAGNAHSIPLAATTNGKFFSCTPHTRMRAWPWSWR